MVNKFIRKVLFVIISNFPKYLHFQPGFLPETYCSMDFCNFILNDKLKTWKFYNVEDENSYQSNFLLFLHVVHSFDLFSSMIYDLSSSPYFVYCLDQKCFCSFSHSVIVF